MVLDGRDQINADETSDPTVNTPQSNIVQAPWSCQYPGVQQVVNATALETGEASLLTLRFFTVSQGN